MHIKILAKGERAPEGWDFIRVEQSSPNAFVVTGVRAPAGAAVLSAQRYQTYREAADAGQRWAEENGSEIVYLETV